jgi:hypothetical protein
VRPRVREITRTVDFLGPPRWKKIAAGLWLRPELQEDQI